MFTGYIALLVLLVILHSTNYLAVIECVQRPVPEVSFCLLFPQILYDICLYYTFYLGAI